MAAADQFYPEDEVAEIREFGNGNVNDTFLVSPRAENSGRFILQRINPRVFRFPELVMQNIVTFTRHAFERLERAPLAGRRWEIPRVLLTRDSRDCWRDPDGYFWRAISFIGNACSFDTINGIEHAREVGFALGFFHNLVSDLPPDRLGDTLEGFHVTPLYLQRYDAVLEKTGTPRSSESLYCRKFINDRRPFAGVLEDALARGLLMLRPIHGDPKVNNIMIDTETLQAVSIVDLDTVKPGLVQYDIGDCLRSCCNPIGEETDKFDEVCFEPDLCRAILQGYIPAAREFLTDADYGYIFHSVRLIAFELGLRFFTDYLEGDVYFKVKYREHNLTRALVQFRLAESIESREREIRAIVRDLK